MLGSYWMSDEMGVGDDRMSMESKGREGKQEQSALLIIRVIAHLMQYSHPPDANLGSRPAHVRHVFRPLRHPLRDASPRPASRCRLRRGRAQWAVGWPKAARPPVQRAVRTTPTLLLPSSPCTLRPASVSDVRLGLDIDGCRCCSALNGSPCCDENGATDCAGSPCGGDV